MSSSDCHLEEMHWLRHTYDMLGPQLAQFKNLLSRSRHLHAATLAPLPPIPPRSVHDLISGAAARYYTHLH
jgi:hypothetical protein